MPAKTIIVLVLAAVVAAVPVLAGDSRQSEHVELTVAGIPNPVHYYIMRPLDFKPDKAWPMLVVIPGSHDPEEGGVEQNRGKKGVKFWAYQGTEKFFTISVWYGNNNNAYPHGDQPNAVTITDAMIRDMLDRYPVDRNRIFIQAFSQGGLLIRNLLVRYTTEAPCVFAGLLLTDANCRGGSSNSACLSNDTAVFVGVGSEDRQPAEPFNNVEEALRWVSIFVTL